MTPTTAYHLLLVGRENIRHDCAVLPLFVKVMQESRGVTPSVPRFTRTAQAAEHVIQLVVTRRPAVPLLVAFIPAPVMRSRPARGPAAPSRSRIR